MTRETRIGLLVGLGFIITFGLVLTELTSTGKPVVVPAVLSGAEELAVAAAEDISPVVVNPQETPPRLGVPIRPSPAAVLMAAGAGAPEDSSGPGEIVAVVGSPGEAPPAAVELPTAPRITPAAEIMPAPPVPVAAPTAVVRTYTVQPDDSLIKIARKVYGPDRGDDYVRIFEANRDKLTSPSLVVAGQVLVIPERREAERAAPAGLSGVRQVALEELPEALAAAGSDAPQPSAQRSVYVVRCGDTLTKIARKTLNDGSRSAVMSIFDANRSSLSDPDCLPVGVALVIPS